MQGFKKGYNDEKLLFLLFLGGEQGIQLSSAIPFHKTLNIGFITLRPIMVINNRSDIIIIYSNNKVMSA